MELNEKTCTQKHLFYVRNLIFTAVPRMAVTCLSIEMIIMTQRKHNIIGTIAVVPQVSCYAFMYCVMENNLFSVSILFFHVYSVIQLF